jgi:replicative DNA helicase
MFGASYFFEFKGAHQPFAGNGVVVGFDADSGDSVDASSTLEEIKSKVKFLSLEEIKRKYRGASMKTASYYTSQIDKVANEIRSLVTAGELSREDGYALELGLDEVSDEIEKEAELVSPFSSDNKQASTKLQKPASYYTSQIDKVANEIRSLVTAGELSPEDGYALELGLDEVSDEIEKEASALEHDADEKYMADFGKEPGAREVDSDEPYMKGFGIRGQDAFLEMKSAKKLDARKLAKKRNAVK